MRIVIAEDSVLLRAGLTRLLAEAGEDVVSAVGDADGAGRRGRAQPARPRHRRRPHAADLHRRGHPRRGDDPPHPSGDRRARALPVRRGALRDRPASPATPRASATCSRTASPTCRDFLEAVRRVGEGGTALDPEVVSQLLARSRRARPARPADRARARGARPHGRGPLEQRHRRRRWWSATARSRSTSATSSPSSTSSRTPATTAVCSPSSATWTREAVVTTTFPPFPPPPTDAPPGGRPPGRAASRQPPRQRKLWHRVVALIATLGAVVVVAWGCLSLVDIAARTTTRTSRTVPATSTLRLELDGGSAVTIIGEERTDIRIDRKVRKGLRDVEARERVEGDTLVLESNCPILLGTLCRVDYALRVPTGTDVVGSTAGGHMRMIRLGRIDVSSGGGGIDLERVTRVGRRAHRWRVDRRSRAALRPAPRPQRRRLHRRPLRHPSRRGGRRDRRRQRRRRRPGRSAALPRSTSGPVAAARPSRSRPTRRPRAPSRRGAAAGPSRSGTPSRSRDPVRPVRAPR